MVDSPAVWAASVIALVLVFMTAAQLLRGRHREQSRLVVVWICVAAGSAVVLASLVGRVDGPEQGISLMGEYLQETAFAVDTLLAFAVILRRRLPDGNHAAAALYGVIGTVLLRALFILIVGGLLSRYGWLLLVISAFVIYGAVKLATARQHQLHAAGSTTVENTPVTERLAGRYLPPMLAAAAALTLADPMAWPDTSPPYLLIAANVLALLPVPVLIRYADKILAVVSYMPLGVSVVAGFVGVKIFLQGLSGNLVPFINGGEPVAWAPVIGSVVSLATTVVVVGVAFLASYLRFRRAERNRARAIVTRAPVTVLPFRAATPSLPPSRSLQAWTIGILALLAVAEIGLSGKRGGNCPRFPTSAAPRRER